MHKISEAREVTSADKMADHAMKELEQASQIALVSYCDSVFFFHIQ